MNDVYCQKCGKLFCTQGCRKDLCPECQSIQQAENMKQAQVRHEERLASVESNREALKEAGITRQVYGFAPRQDD